VCVPGLPRTVVDERADHARAPGSGPVTRTAYDALPAGRRRRPFDDDAEQASTPARRIDKALVDLHG
jgi:hypothetical protein